MWSPQGPYKVRTSIVLVYTDEETKAQRGEQLAAHVAELVLERRQPDLKAQALRNYTLLLWGGNAVHLLTDMQTVTFSFNMVPSEVPQNHWLLSL